MSCFDGFQRRGRLGLIESESDRPRRRLDRRLFDQSAASGGPFALNMSADTIQLPSSCFFQAVRYLPLTRIRPLSDGMVIS